MGVFFKSILLIILGSAFYSCKTVTPQFRSQDKNLESVINQSIQYFGGIEKNQSLITLCYNKKVILYTEDGQIEKQILEQHNYNFREGIFSIKRKVGDIDTEFYMKNEKYYAVINGEKNESSSTKTTFNTAFYVTGMPFKFLDDGVQLQLLDKKNNLLSVQANYNPDTNPNHTGDEKWIYFIDSNNGNIVKQIAYASDHISLINNNSYHTVEGYKFIKKRTSYRVDDNFDIIYKRADYDYFDLKITFK